MSVRYALDVNSPLAGELLEAFIATGRVELRCDSCLRIWPRYDEWLSRRNLSTQAPSTGEAVPGNGSPSFFRRLALVDDSDSRLPAGLRVRAHRVVGSLSSWKEKKEN